MKSAKMKNAAGQSTPVIITRTVRPLLMIFLLLVFSCCATGQTSVQVGTSTSVSAYTPVYSFNVFNYSQQIYKGSENSLSTYSGQYITAIRFYWTGTGNLTNANSWVIYMGNTAQASFSSTTNWISTVSMTQVYNGTVSFPSSAGWMTIVLDAPFQYTGNNIVVAVDENVTGYSGSGCTFQYTSATNDVLYYRNDVTNPDPASPPTGTLSASRPNIQFDFFNSAIPANVVTVNATTGTTTRSYPNVKYAFDAINSGIHQGNVTMEIGSADNQTLTVTSQSELLASGTGSASYSGLLIRPAYSNVTVSGAFPSSGTTTQGIINLTGSQNVVIDGRIGSSGCTKDLTIENSSTNGYASAIIFSGADNDTLRYCTIKSSTTSATTGGTGTVSFQYHSTGLGCNNNVIEYCDISKSGANLPYYAIASSNTNSTNKSENNTVRNCSISDFQRAGIWLGNTGLTDYNNLWTISDNTFFESVPVTISTSNYLNWAVYIGYHSSSNAYKQTSGVFTITGNTIGGNGAGGNWAINSTTGTYTVSGGIFLYGSTTEYSEVSGNTIGNFSIQTYVADELYYKLYGFNGIYNHLGKVKIGTSAGNEIHDISVVHSSSSWGGFICGIYSSTGSNLSCEIMNNSIHDISLLSGNNEFQYFYGIYSYAGSSISTNRTNNNSIYNIDALKGRYVHGLYIDGGAESNHISRIATDGTIGELYGIRWAVTGSSNAPNCRIDNNEIILGTDRNGNSTAISKNIFGIHTNSQDVYLYYNSVLIDGIASTNNSACLRINTTGIGPIAVNNLLYNNRSGGAGRHLSISAAIDLTTYPTYLTSSNNAYIFGINLGEYNTPTAFSGGTVAADLDSWTAAATNETNSRDTLNTGMPATTFFPNLATSTDLYPSADKWLCAGIVVSQTADIINTSRHNPAPTTIGAYELDCPTILPVELLFFESECIESGVILNWITASENNNNYFTIEKSSDGVNFEPVISVEGAGNSNQLLYYNAIDDEVSPELTYYRLRQTDFDGSISYSEIISTDCSQPAYSVIISPNPVWEHLDIYLYGADVQKIKVSVFNSIGQEFEINTVIEESKISVSFPEKIPPGHYILRVSDEHNINTCKFIKM